MKKVKKTDELIACLCQTAPRLYDIAGNEMEIIDQIHLCAEGDGDLALFPELALTGYDLGESVDEMCRLIEGRGSIERIRKVSEETGVDVVFGFPLRERGKYYSAAVYIEGGEILAIHKKIYLAHYGHSSEKDYLSPGNRMTCVNTRYGRVAVLISEDAWHLSTSLMAAQQGAMIIIICAATSIVDKQALYRIQFSWETINTATALSQTLFVLYNNRSGQELERTFWGGSHIINGNGVMAVKAPLFSTSCTSTRLNLSSLKRIRTELPLVKEERGSVALKRKR